MPIRPRAFFPAIIFLLATAATGVAAQSAAAWVADGVPVCTAPGGQTEPVATADGAGGIVIAWTDRRSPLSAIYATRLTASGAVAAGWPVNGRPVTQTSAGQYNPSIVSDGAGGAIIAWVDKRGGLAADVYAQHIAASGSNAVGWSADGLPICRDPLYQGPPLMCSDGAGGAYVALQNGRAGSKSLISVTRLTGAGTYAPGWSECGYPLGDGTWHETDPQIARDDAGGVLVVWSDWRLGGAGAPDIMAERLTPAGAPDPIWGGWVCRAVGAQRNPVVTSDGAGGAVIAWLDERSGPGDDVYALRVTVLGAIPPGWSADGVPVCTSPGLQYGLRIVQDGHGGAIMVWSDANAELSDATEVRAQRVTGAGVVYWPGPGVLCHDVPYGSILRGVVADGAGGAVIAAEDAVLSAGVQYDVYVDHVTGLGQVDRGRFPACRELHQQQRTVLVGDGAGGAILAWQDLRNTPAGSVDFAVFAQHVGASEYIVDVPGIPASAPVFALGRPRPNPSRGVFAVEFSLPDAAPATLELIDLSGRRLRAIDVGGLGAGRHVVRFGEDRPLSPGICWIRLARAARVLATRVVVLH